MLTYLGYPRSPKLPLLSSAPTAPRSLVTPEPKQLHPHPPRPLLLTINDVPRTSSATGPPRASLTSLVAVFSPPVPAPATPPPGTPRRGESDVRRLHYQSPPRRSWELGTDQAAIQFEDDVDRASTLMALYDIRSKIKQQDNSSLLKAREKINALAARQQAQQAAERNMKAADELRRQRYSFPRAGL
ncbi:hypothetical protein NM208_g12260 [Fusarium decemcellulare]|uniref:Uncharacterized protein n=1 Tax=Fusarium decemcellulare TaxID=57161 RepID=A0ACC1RQJ8_9HYPO|nr:hypothetical protein NM208_g12260 [Fusarium decemcellulare]